MVESYSKQHIFICTDIYTWWMLRMITNHQDPMKKQKYNQRLV